MFISRRLSLSSSGRKKSPAVVVAVIAVALSTAVMVAAISIVGGFKREIENKIVGFNSHITLYAAADEGEDNNVSLTPTLREILQQEPFVTGVSLDASIPAVLKTDSDFKGVYFKGFSAESDSTFLSASLIDGEFPDFGSEAGDSTIIVSAKAASELGLKVGQKLNTYFFSDDIKVRPLTVAGIVDTHFEAYDDVFVFGSLRLVQQIAGISESKGTAIRVKTDDFRRIAEYSKQIHNRLLKAFAENEIYTLYGVDNALRQGAPFFNWLSLLDTNVAVILTLMIIVGCVTLVSGMLIVILDKIKLIGLLKALGAPNRGIRTIFIMLALRICLWGMLIGNALILSLLWIQQKTHLLAMDPDAYYIDFVPVKFDWPDILLLNAGVFLLSWLALLIPSAFASRVSPAETMKTE